jgi:arginine/ornithine transport system substrate-binding protein
LPSDSLLRRLLTKLAPNARGGRASADLGRGGARPEELRFLVGELIPPVTFRDADGRPVGFEIDLAAALAGELGRPHRFVLRPTASVAHMLQALLAGEGEAIINSLAVTPERQQQVAFTEPYLQDDLRFAAPKDFAQPPTREGLQGTRIGVSEGSVAETQARELFGGSADIVALPGGFDRILEALTRRQIDVGLGSLLLVYQFVSSPRGRGFRLLDAPGIQPVSIAIAVRRQDEALREQFNVALRRMKSDGRLEAIRAKWLPFRN